MNIQLKWNVKWSKFKINPSSNRAASVFQQQLVLEKLRSRVKWIRHSLELFPYKSIKMGKKMYTYNIWQERVVQTTKFKNAGMFVMIVFSFLSLTIQQSVRSFWSSERRSNSMDTIAPSGALSHLLEVFFGAVVFPPKWKEEWMEDRVKYDRLQTAWEITCS